MFCRRNRNGMDLCSYWSLVGMEALFFDAGKPFHRAMVWEEGPQRVLWDVHGYSRQNNPGLPDTHVFRLKHEILGGEHVAGQCFCSLFCCQQDTPYGIWPAGQYFGPNVKALEGLFHRLPVDSNEKGDGSRCNCLDYSKPRQKYIAWNERAVFLSQTLVVSRYFWGPFREPGWWRCQMLCSADSFSRGVRLL